MARLTSLSKFIITLLIVGLIGFGFYMLKNSGILPNPNQGDPPIVENGKDGEGGILSKAKDRLKNAGKKDPATNSGSESDDVIKVGVVTWGGYAGGQYFNEGFKANKNSRFYKDYGFEVEFKVLDDFDASRNAFKADDVNLLWCTIDAFPTEVEGLSDYDPQVVFQADWSRGGDAVVVKRGINSVADLKGKKVAVAAMTPSHTFLLWLLEAGDLNTKDIKIVEVPSAIDAADAFKSGTVDAAVVWSPDDADCVDKVPGAKVLQNTKNATHIIADVFLAKKSYVEQNRTKLQQLYEGWMKGAAELNSSDDAKRKAAKILADGLGQPEDFCYDAINNVRLTTHGDNLNFFGLNKDYTGVTGEDLYNKMKKVYHDIGYAPKKVRSWRLVASRDVVPQVNLSGKEHASEVKKTFKPATKADVTKPAISTKRISITFPTGSSTLGDNAKTLIDLQFKDIAKGFANAKIRIEGNTDNTGSKATNIALSKKRAQAVADYLKVAYTMDPNRFVIVGNGPDKPVASNETQEGRAKNRRTDFQLIAD